MLRELKATFVVFAAFYMEARIISHFLSKSKLELTELTGGRGGELIAICNFLMRGRGGAETELCGISDRV